MIGENIDISQQLPEEIVWFTGHLCDAVRKMHVRKMHAWTISTLVFYVSPPSDILQTNP